MLEPNTSFILCFTTSSINVLAFPKYFLGSNTAGSSANVFLIAAVIANLKSVSTFIFETPEILASCKISSGTPFAPGISPPYLLHISTSSGITVDAPCNTIGVFGNFCFTFANISTFNLAREYRAKEAGYRTHFLVSLGSALIMIVSQYGFMEVVKMEGIDLDPSRVAAQVVSGIGFIGAGTIIFQKQIVRGLTTAAGIWATSGIGLAIGAGMYWLGISATILTLIGLEALSYLFKSIGMKSSMVEFSTDNKETLNRMAKKFNSKEYNIVSYQLDEKRLGEVTTYYVTMVIKSKKYNDEGMLLTLLQDFSDITVHRLE